MSIQNHQCKNINEALSHCIEEAGEFLFWAGKTQRFGWQDYHEKYDNEPCYHAVYREVSDLEVRIKGLKKLMEAEFGL